MVSGYRARSLESEIKKTRNYLKAGHIHYITRISIFIVFILIFSRMIDVELLKEAVQDVRIEIVLIAILLYFGNIAIRAYRWKRILNKDEHRLSFKDAYMMTLIGIALNIFVPATLGDIARSYYGYKIYGIKEEMLSTVIVDKMFALCSLFLLGMMSGYIMGYYGLGTVSLFSGVLSFIPPAFPNLVPWNAVNTILGVFKKSLDIEKLLKAFTLSARLKVFVMLISIGGWLCTCVFFYVLCSAFPVKVSLGYIILIMPIITIVRLFPFTVNALGPMEIAVAYFFSVIGINSTLAVLISLSSNLITSIIPGSIGFLIILAIGHGIKHPKNKEQTVP
jgi:uncharacterized membrane protein YbhN (UPF0104 family)